MLVTEESGRLARWLRLMGHDAATGAAEPLAALYRRAVNEARVIVTRNGRVQEGRLVRVIHLDRRDLAGQLRQVMRALGLTLDADRAFSRCDVCNVALQAIEKPQVKEQVPPYVFQTQDAFHACPSCRRVYWAATHHQRASAFLKTVAEAAGHA